MLSPNQLERDFFARHTLQVARSLLGVRLVRIDNGKRTAGLITECEAYRGEEDLGCHAKAGLTNRTRVMFGPPGYAYVYFTYGKHWMLNIVTEKEGFPAAVLIRSIWPIEGVERISARRPGMKRTEWTNGPGKICQALDIDKRLNGLDLCIPNTELFLEYALEIPNSAVTITPRVGLNTVPEPWKSIPWRFMVKQEVFGELITNLCPI
jgi:DNA-3-methyladenine glycosylase